MTLRHFLASRLRRRGRRGSVAVEFALITVFILFPLVAGCWDLLTAITVQTELNTALRTMFYYAESNPPDADGLDPAVAGTNALSLLLAQVNLPNTAEVGKLATPISFVTTTETIGNSSVQANGYCYVSSTPPVTACPGTPVQCSAVTPPSGTNYVNYQHEVYVCYRLQATVTFPISIPPFTKPLILGATGGFEIY